MHDDEFRDAWLTAAVPHMSVKCAEIISKWGGASNAIVNAQGNLQELLFELWQHAFFGVVPKGYSGYAEFMDTAEAVDSGIASATALSCPFASKLSVFRYNKTNEIQAKLHARLIDEWVEKYKSDPVFKQQTSWTLLGRMVDSDKYFGAHKYAWDHEAHGPYSLEVGLDLWAAHYGGGFSGANVIVTALMGLSVLPTELLALQLRLSNLIGEPEESNPNEATKDALEQCDLLLKVIAEAFRLRHPVPIIQREVSEPGAIVCGVELPVGTAVIHPTRANGLASVFGENKDSFDISRWTPEMMDNYAHKVKPNPDPNPNPNPNAKPNK